MSDRTDLFKALSHFMATLAAYAPGSHREDVVLEVGDAAFRAFERELEPRARYLLKESSPVHDYELQVHSEAGSIVIRRRAGTKTLEDLRADLLTPIVSPCCERDTDGDGNCDRHRTVISASTPVVPVCGFRSPEGLACMKYEGHAFEHVVGDASSEKAVNDLKTYSARQERKTQLEREKFAAKDRKRMEPPTCFGCGSSEGTLFNTQETPQTAPLGRIYVHMWDSCRRAMSDKVHALVGAEPSGINSVVRGAPPEETKPPAHVCRYATLGCSPHARCAPCQVDAARDQRSATPPARAHLNGCVLDADHKSPCTTRRCPHDNVGCGTTRVCRVCEEERRPNLSPFRQDSDNLKPPSISPRQALGEALACVERARDLLGAAAMTAEDVGFSVRVAAIRAYDSVESAWGNITTARALLAQQEKPK